MLRRPLAAYEAFAVDYDRSPHCADAELELRMCERRRGGCAEEQHAAVDCLRRLHRAMSAEAVVQAYWRDPRRALEDRPAPSYEQAGRFGLLRRLLGPS